MFKKIEEYDYSPEAKKQHMNAVREADRQEAMSGVRPQLNDVINKQFEHGKTKALELLKEFFDAPDVKARKEAFAKFKGHCNKHGIKITEEVIKKCHEIWLSYQQDKAA